MGRPELGDRWSAGRVRPPHGQRALGKDPLKRRIVADFNPDRIILFGSQARGEARADSDLDLLVIVPDDRDRQGLIKTIRASLADIGIDKDVFVSNPQRVARYGDVIGSLLESALREGVTIYARS